ncbi:hypothetical protein TNCV_15791, partial [Trichonephila clavipes]
PPTGQNGFFRPTQRGLLENGLHGFFCLQVTFSKAD